ncbi:MAG: hypothetical protein JO061_09805 [Acidobacteriaceae bacterium]|nr:hypothetical protein [Acidobacteriaceae bacterium]
MRRAFFLFLLSCATGLLMQGTPSFSLLPSGGTISGAPGSTVGWGFTVTDSSEYVVITGSSFTPSSLYGTYQDFTGSAALIVAGPSPENQTVSQPFDATAMSGLGAFTIFSTTPTNTKISGNLVIDYSLFSQDPNSPTFDPDTSTLVADANVSLPAAVNVAPEPLLAPVLGLALAAVGLAAKRRKNA